MPTTIPGTLAAYFALVKATMPAGVQVTLGQEGLGVAEEYVVVGFKLPMKQTWGAMGRLRRDETYEIDSRIRVESGNDDLMTRITRAYELFSLVEAALALDPSLGQPSRNNVVLAPTDSQLTSGYGAANGGTGAELIFAVGVKSAVYNI